MAATKHEEHALLEAARRLLDARDSGMVTAIEWDDLATAVAALAEPAAAERDESFHIDELGALVRTVVPAPGKGEPYQHRCDRASFEAVAHAIDGFTGPFTGEEIRAAAEVPFSQAMTAFAFLKERGVIVPGPTRTHLAAGSAPFEDAMIELLALVATSASA